MGKILEANSPIATVLGGSGFVGRYVVRRLVKQGWRVRVGVRNPNEALFLKTYGEVGQVEVYTCSIFDTNALSGCISGSKIVVNAVAGLLNEVSKIAFQNYYIHGPELIAKKCKEFEVERFIHISSVGVNSKSSSLYSRTKAVGEKKIMEHFPDATIVRPSLILGHEDKFFNRYASMAVYSFIIPVIGGNTKVQPVYVDDVALAVEKIIMKKDFCGIIELGGPETFSFNDLIKKILVVIRRKRIILRIPPTTANLMAMTFEFFKKITLGFAPLPFTRDNVLQLKVDNVVSTDGNSFKELDIEPKNVDTIIPLYLFSYRPHGQYNDVTKSANKSN